MRHVLPDRVSPKRAKSDRDQGNLNGPSVRVWKSDAQCQRYEPLKSAGMGRVGLDRAGALVLSMPFKKLSFDFWRCTLFFPLFGPFDAHRHHS